jgi:hypothetical protein
MNNKDFTIKKKTAKLMLSSLTAGWSKLRGKISKDSNSLMVHSKKQFYLN